MPQEARQPRVEEAFTEQTEELDHDIDEDVWSEGLLILDAAVYQNTISFLYLYFTPDTFKHFKH